jgi:hypothetical protein
MIIKWQRRKKPQNDGKSQKWRAKLPQSEAAGQ